MIVGASATVVIVAFAAIAGPPDVTVLHEGNWCGAGLPWWAAATAIAAMVLYLASIAALARALPTIRTET